jgi:NitT/TauT family transport system substrate-binding protein
MRFRGVALIAALALAIAECGGDDKSDGSAGGGGSEPATLKVATIPTAAAAPLFVGIDRGFFKEEGLTVTTQFAAGGAAIIPAIQTGDMDIGFGNTVSLFIAAEKGLDFKLIAAGQVSPTDEGDDETALMVPKGSRVKKAADLRGATIGVNTLKNVAELSISAALEKAGVDPKTIKYTEVPFPEALPTIQSGDVQAAFFGEPFTTQGDKAGAKTILRPFSAGVPGGQIGAYFVSEKWLDEHGDVAERFARAMKKANQFVIDNPDALRDSVPKFTEVPVDVAEEMRLPVFVPEIDPKGLQSLSDLSAKYGLLKQPVDTSGMLVSGN